MEVSEFYPSPRDLIENELRLLEYLLGSTYIAAEHPRFVNDAKMYHSQYNYGRLGFRFVSFLDVAHAGMPRAKGSSKKHGKPKANLRLIIAALVEQEEKTTYSNISYALVVTRLRSNHPSILRKFHFDLTGFDADGQLRRQPHPLCHLQYCGEMIPLMGDMGFRAAQLEQMHANLSEPRLFFWPMSLALLIDMALHEFPDPDSNAFRATPEWRKIVRENEKLLLQRFYEKCVDVIADKGKRKRTLADEFYVG